MSRPTMEDLRAKVGAMKCEHCGCETDASINGLPFCVKKACIEATVKQATTVGRELRRIIEAALVPKATP